MFIYLITENEAIWQESDKDQLMNADKTQSYDDISSPIIQPSSHTKQQFHNYNPTDGISKQLKREYIAAFSDFLGFQNHTIECDIATGNCSFWHKRFEQEVS